MFDEECTSILFHFNIILQIKINFDYVCRLYSHSFLYPFIIVLSSLVINLKKKSELSRNRTATDCVILEYQFFVREMVRFRVRTNAVVQFRNYEKTDGEEPSV